MSKEADQPGIRRLTLDMNFEWDEGKRERNISKHGIDFAETIAALPQAILAAGKNRLWRETEHGDYRVARRSGDNHLHAEGRLLPADLGAEGTRQ